MSSTMRSHYKVAAGSALGPRIKGRGSKLQPPAPRIQNRSSRIKDGGHPESMTKGQGPRAKDLGQAKDQRLTCDKTARHFANMASH